MSDYEKDIVHLARLALDGKSADVAAISRRLLRAVAVKRPDLAASISSTLEKVKTSPVREAQPLPVDVDSRLELLRNEPLPQLPIEPTWPSAIRDQLKAVVEERAQEQKLEAAGISPTRSLLFIGPPGVGKTMAARWLAIQTGRPLLTLDLAAVMSSFLGRTGNNIRVVLDFARRSPSVLLLDEFDAIAKRRDDTSEVGELKRLVTVLLQAVDDWPVDGLLIAATNHPELLDPAVWRRFERIVEFPHPTTDEISASIRQLLGDSVSEKDIEMLASLLSGRSFADVAKVINDARRSSVIHEHPIKQSIEQAIADRQRPRVLPPLRHRRAIHTSRGIIMTPTERQILLSSLAPKVPPQVAIDNLEMVCSRTGLDWMQRHAYLIERGGKWRVELSIDGFRAVAASQPTYLGQEGPYWVSSASGQWSDVPPDGEPYACKVGVATERPLRPDIITDRSSNTPYTTWGVARFADYAAGPMWKKFPATMISKCAEALALRKAFPAKLGGYYGEDEMAQASRGITPTSDLPSRTKTAEVSIDHTFEAMIQAAKSVEELAEVGKKIREANLPDLEVGALNKLYVAKKVSL